MHTKFCSKCNETKPISDFAKNRTRHDGLQSHCKCCVNSIKSAWQISNRDKKRESQAAWQSAHLEKHRIKQQNRRAVTPLALGGTNTDDNIQLLRALCNFQKKAKHPVDFMQQRGFLL